MEQNAARTGQACVTFRDVSVQFVSKYKLRPQDRKMIRFLDSENLKIITHADHVLFRKAEQRACNFIIQVGQQDLIRRE